MQVRPGTPHFDTTHRRAPSELKEQPAAAEPEPQVEEPIEAPISLSNWGVMGAEEQARIEREIDEQLALPTHSRLQPLMFYSDNMGGRRDWPRMPVLLLRGDKDKVVLGLYLSSSDVRYALGERTSEGIREVTFNRKNLCLEQWRPQGEHELPRKSKCEECILL